MTPEVPGRYVIEGVLGRGQRSVVYLAFDRHSGRDLALRELSPGGDDQADGEARREAFLHEARVTGQLEHPGIAPVYEIGIREDGTLYYTQRAVRGRTLATELEACQSAKERLALLPHFIDACNAVAFAHARGVTHGHLTPRNILVGTFGETVVLNWGKSGEPKGADLTGLGRILAAVIGRSSAEAPPELRMVVDRALERDPTAHYPTADRIAADVTAFLQGGRVSVYTYSSRELLRKMVARRPALAAALAATVLSLIVASALLARSRRGERELLAWSWLARARGAELRVDWDRAAARYAAARLEADSPQARWGAALAQARSLPMLGEPLPTEATALARLSRGRLALAEPAGLRVLVAGRTPAAIWPSVGRVRQLLSDEEGLAAISAQGITLLHPSGRPGPPMAGPTDEVALVGGQLIRAAGARVLATDPTKRQLLVQINDTLSLREADGRELAAAPAPVKLLAAALSEDRVYLIDAAGTLEARQRATLTPLVSASARPPLALSPDGSLLAAADPTGGLLLLDARALEPLARSARPGNLLGLALLDDGTLAALGASGMLMRFDAAQAARAARLFHEDGVFCSTALSPDGRVLATGTDGSAIHLWDAATGKPLGAFPAGEGMIRSVRISPDGRMVAASTARGDVAIRSLTKGPVLRGARRRSYLAELAFSPDSTLLYALSDAGSIDVYSVVDASLVRSIETRLAGSEGLAISPDGRTLAFGAESGQLAILTAPFDAPPRIVQHLDPLDIDAVAFSPDGRLLAAGGGAGSLALVHVHFPHTVKRISAHRDRVQDVLFDPKGRYLATTGMDRAVRLWSITGEPLAERPGHEGISLATTAAGDVLAVGGLDSLIRLYPLDGLWAAPDPAEQLRSALSQGDLSVDDDGELSPRPRGAR